MDDGAALLSAIHASLHDDAPRLVYADWLLEKGDPQGELIVLQCRRSSGAVDPTAIDRETELLERHDEWLGELAGVAREPEFERGFLSSARISAHDDAVARRLSDPIWATLQRLVLWEAGSGAAMAPSTRLLARLPAVQSVAISCATAQVVPEWTRAMLEVWDRLTRIDIDAPGLEVRFSRRGQPMALRVELKRGWTYWANCASNAMFQMLATLARTRLWSVHVIDSRTADRLTHRELRRLRRELERVERVRLPKA